MSKKKKSKKKIPRINKRNTNQKEFIIPEHYKQLSEKDTGIIAISDIFFEKMWGIKDSYELFYARANKDLDDFDKMLKIHASKHKIKKTDLLYLTNLIVQNPQKDFANEEVHIQILSKKDDLSKSITIYSEALYVLLFSRFEANLEKLYNIFSTYYPATIQEKIQFSTGELRAYSSLSEVQRFAQEQKINKWMHEPRTKQHQWLKDEVQFEFDKHDKKVYNQFLEFRNCIVHKDSILTKDQVDSVKAVMRESSTFDKDRIDGYTLLGIPLVIDRNCFCLTYEYLCIIGFQMILAFWNNIGSKYENIFLISTGIYLKYMISKEFYISQKLFKNILDSKIYRNDADNISATLAYCVSLKYSGESKSCLKKLSEIDWTHLSHKDLILKYGIEDNVDGVVNCMKVLVKNNTVNFLGKEIPIKHFLKWGFFDDIREDPKYERAYEEIFGVPQTTYVYSSDLIP